MVGSNSSALKNPNCSDKNATKNISLYCILLVNGMIVPLATVFCNSSANKYRYLPVMHYPLQYTVLQSFCPWFTTLHLVLTLHTLSSNLHIQNCPYGMYSRHGICVPVFVSFWLGLFRSLQSQFELNAGSCSFAGSSSKTEG